MSILDVLKDVLKDVVEDVTGGEKTDVEVEVKDPYDTGSIETVDIDLTGAPTEVTEVEVAETDDGGLDLGSLIGSVLGGLTGDNKNNDLLHQIGGFIGGLVDKTAGNSDFDLSDLLSGAVKQLKGKEDAPDTTEVNALTSGISSIAGDALEDEETRAMITTLLKDVSKTLKEDE